MGLQVLALAAAALGAAQPGELFLHGPGLAPELLAVVLFAELDELLRVDVRDPGGLLRAGGDGGHRREVRLGFRDHVHVGVQLTTDPRLDPIRERRQLQEPNVGRGLALGLGGGDHGAGVAEQERGLRPVLLVLKQREPEQRRRSRAAAASGSPTSGRRKNPPRGRCGSSASPRMAARFPLTHRSLPHRVTTDWEGKLTP